MPCLYKGGAPTIIDDKAGLGHLGGGATNLGRVYSLVGPMDEEYIPLQSAENLDMLTAGVDGLRKMLVLNGICTLAPVYSPEQLSIINSRVNERFAAREAEDRAYIKIDEMLELGILDTIFSKNMKNILFSIVENPVLYHCHMYEISANNNSPHIFGETLSGFHADPDSNFDAKAPTHVSIFVYLTEVLPESGPFEFVPKPPTRFLTQKTPVVQMTGAPGSTFAWNRSFYHRAAPNVSPVRRRLLKLSIQPKGIYNPLIEAETFQRVRDVVGLSADRRILHLIGLDTDLPAAKPIPLDAKPPPPTRTLDLPLAALTKANARTKFRLLKRAIVGQGQQQHAVTYD